MKEKLKKFAMFAGGVILVFAVFKFIKPRLPESVQMWIPG